MKDPPKRQGDQVEALSMSQERNLKQGQIKQTLEHTLWVRQPGRFA